MGYEVACSCGNLLPVTEGMADSSTYCSCGRTVRVPSLNELQRQAATEPLLEVSHPAQLRPVAASSDASAPPTEAALPLDRLAEFQRTLAGLTPRVYMTPMLIGVNVLFFILMTAFGVSLIDPTIPDLLRWGADFGPNTIGGEWWRLLTSMFIHIGIIHILLNMWVLAVAGPLVERMIGNVGFLLLYLVAGLSGSLASLFWNPMLVSAGASGAIFGIYGALLGLLLRQHGSIPKEALAQLRNSGLGFLVYNLVYGIMQPNIDTAAHIGGLASGFLGGLVLSPPFTPEALAGRTVRNLLVSGLGVFLVGGGMVGVHGRHAAVADVQSELDRFEAVEKKALDAYNSAVGKAQRQELTDAAFADLLEHEVLPEYRVARERLTALKQIPAPLQRHVASILEYMRLREQAWTSFGQALREGSPQKVQQAMEKQKLADAAAKRISDSADK
jgi:rhomboid protease GluP